MAAHVEVVAKELLKKLGEVTKKQHRERADLMMQLYHQIQPSKEPHAIASSSTSSEVMFVDIDGTLIHGTRNTAINEGLIEQLQQIKLKQPSLKIYLFSSMGYTALVRPEAVSDRVKLINELERIGLIDGVVTTTDLKLKTGPDQPESFLAGRFYSDVFKPIMQILYDEDGNKRVFASHEQLVNAFNPLRENALFKPVFDEFTFDKEKNNDDNASAFINACKDFFTAEKGFGLTGDETGFERKANEKGRLFNLFKQSFPDTTMASLIDDSVECIAAFIEVCQQNDIRFFVHNAKDYTGFLELSESLTDEDKALFDVLVQEEYIAFRALYEAFKSNNLADYQQALDNLSTIMGMSANLTKRDVLHLPSADISVDDARDAQKETKNLVKKMGGFTGLYAKYSGTYRGQIKRDLIMQQLYLQTEASKGNPLAMYRLAVALTPNKTPIYKLERDAKGVITAAELMEPDVVASYYLTQSARLLLGKLPDKDQAELQPQVNKLLQIIEKDLNEQGISVRMAIPRKDSLNINGMNALELYQFLRLRERANDNLTRASADASSSETSASSATDPRMFRGTASNTSTSAAASSEKDDATVTHRNSSLG